MLLFLVGFLLKLTEMLSRTRRRPFFVWLPLSSSFSSAEHFFVASLLLFHLHHLPRLLFACSFRPPDTPGAFFGCPALVRQRVRVFSPVGFFDGIPPFHLFQSGGSSWTTGVSLTMSNGDGASRHKRTRAGFRSVLG